MPTAEDVSQGPADLGFMDATKGAPTDNARPREGPARGRGRLARVSVFVGCFHLFNSRIIFKASRRSKRRPSIAFSCALNLS